MSHVDDGALHAYLDGALEALPAAEAARIREHLASCDACARRLDEERAVRAEAQAILRGADPGLEDLPSLEELRALAAAGGARPSAAVRLRRMGWAASIVVAVGAGWMLRGVREPAGPLERIAPEAVAEEGAVDRVDPLAVAAPEAVVEAAPAPPADERGVRQAAGPAGTVKVAEAEREAAVDEAPAAAEAVSPTVSFPASPELSLSEIVVTGVARSRADSGAAVPTGAMAALRDSLLARVGEAKVAPAGEPAPVQPTVPVATPAASRLRPDTRAQEELARRRTEPVAELRAADALAPAPSFVANPLAPPRVPGLPVISTERAPLGLPAGTLRVLQLVETDTLELLLLPPGVDPSSLAPPEEDGLTQVSVPRQYVWLVGRARLSQERIRALLALVPGGR